MKLSSYFVEVLLPGFIDEEINVPHVLDKLLFRVKRGEVRNGYLRDADESFLRPREKPVNGAFIEKCWEISCTVSELLSDR